MTIAKRKLGSKLVNPVGLGCMNICWAYGPPVREDYAAQLLNRALDIGYDHLDTARLYGDGKSEELIGRALQGRRHEFTLASKTGIFVQGTARTIDCSPVSVRNALETSLKLLQTDHIELYYLHRRDFKVPIEETVGAMADMVHEGKIGGIGLSEMSAETLRRAHAVHPITAMQTEYSLMTREAEIAVLATCKELGVAFVAFSPIGRGFLSDGFVSTPQWAEGDLRAGWPRFQEPHYSANMTRIEAFKTIATREGVTAAQLSLGWVLAQGEHIITIPGTQKIEHLEQNIARWDYEPSTAVCAELDALINQQTVAGPRYPAGMQKAIDTEEFA